MACYKNGLKLIAVMSLTTTLLTGCLGATTNDVTSVLPVFPYADDCVIGAIRQADRELISPACQIEVTSWLVKLSKLCQKLDEDC